jgi:hypothetical protein
MLYHSNSIQKKSRTALCWLLSGCAAMFMQCAALASQSVALAWNPNPDTNAVGYKIYYGSTSHVYTNSVSVGNVTNATIAGLLDGTTYYFAATTYDASGVESDFSNEASYNTGGTNLVSVSAIPPVILNSPLALNPLGNLTVGENNGFQVVNLLGIGLGSGNQLTITAVSSNPALIPNPTVNYSSPNANGTLTFAPANDANGTAKITVTVNNGQSQSNLIVRSFTITVKAVNQPPTLNPISNLVLNENSGAQTVSLSGITSGASNEKQTLRVTAASSNRSLIPNPTVAYTSPKSTGKLTFKPGRKASGTATITVTVNDGGKSNNIVTQTFTITVVNPAAVITPVAQSSLSKNISASISITNVAATLTPIASAGPGQFSCNISGVPGYQYIVQASSDLVNWTSVQTNTAPFTFVDNDMGQVSHRFYRAAYIAP